jgi:Protein of unknown function (DUF2911)
MKVLLLFAAAFALSAQSPPASTSVAIAGKTLSVRYGAPSVRGRKIFGPGGLLSQDPTYPAWRAGANSATAFHSDADLDMGGLQVPKGDYTLYAWIEDPDRWQLILSKQTGQWGLTYEPKMDLGRVKMNMSKPAAPVETYKITLSSNGPKTGELKLEWENRIASVPITVK